MSEMTDDVKQFVTFIQNDVPPLKSGEYTVTATQTVTVSQDAQPAITATRKFAVPGNRFRLNGDDIVTVLPAPLANGEFAGVMPLVTLKRTTLPWQRFSVEGDETVPWLAVLVLTDADLSPGQSPPALQSGHASDVLASTAQGDLPAGCLSYPDIYPLDYGQTASDPCAFIDLPVDTFNTICPSAQDLPYLAHIRRTDTYDSADNDSTTLDCAMVLGNRWPHPDADHPDVTAYAYLVSLENMGDYLPQDDGTGSQSLPGGTTHVRLICYRTWHFAANDLAEKFRDLCENLNHDPLASSPLTTLRLPADAPDPQAVQTAIEKQKAGQLADSDADALVRNALCLGYTAMDHHLRDAGTTVTWCRGPLVPFPIQPPAYNSVACADALLRYDPETGLFDASYAQAWQLGQLLALQSGSFSASLYNWKHSLQKVAAARRDMALIEQKLGGAELFAGFFSRRVARLSGQPEVPQDIADWIARLQLLKGVPFSTLVPDEGMLPVESLRFFYLDPFWIAAIVDGAFSIGRAGSNGQLRDADALARVHAASRASARRQRKNQRPDAALRLVAAGANDFGTITGCLLRSQLVSGWSALKIAGYSDTGKTASLTPLRIERLSDDVMICLFDGELKALALEEPPAQLHCGVEWDTPSQAYITTPRYLSGTKAGQQIGNSTVPVKVRPDNQTLQAAATASVIDQFLADRNLQPDKFTSAEFAVEMTQGAAKVGFQVQ